MPIFIIWNLIAANAAGDRWPSVRGQEERDRHCSPKNGEREADGESEGWRR